MRKTNKRGKLGTLPRTFKISIDKKTWESIRPVEGTKKLKPSWTHKIYDAFSKKNPCCVLAFKYQNVKSAGSRKRNCPYMQLKAVCTFPTCKAYYTFWLAEKPQRGQKNFSLRVCRHGQAHHLRRHTKMRPASNIRRGKIAKKISQGVSQTYYDLLGSTPKEAIAAGNLTQALNRDILKTIGYEVRKAAHLHHDVLMEVYMTQQIMKECDTSFIHLSGYIQSFQVDPFCVHMYTEKGIGILLAHLRQKKKLHLYLDATGSIVSKIPEQKKRNLYYALVLAGQGRGTPPLPLAEMVSNDQTVPTISHWLMRFLHMLCKFTRRNVGYVETDFSWALIQAVLTAFNRESIMAYLERSFAVCHGRQEWKSFTIIHLCSAHILKAVSQIIGKNVTDKGHKEFLTFVLCVCQTAEQ